MYLPRYSFSYKIVDPAKATTTSIRGLKRFIWNDNILTSGPLTKVRIIAPLIPLIVPIIFAFPPAVLKFNLSNLNTFNQKNKHIIFNFDLNYKLKQLEFRNLNMFMDSSICKASYPKKRDMIKVRAGTRLDMAVANVTEVKAIASMFKF